MRRFLHIFAALLAPALALTTTPAVAQTRVTLKSATAGSSYYLMTVQLAEMLRSATGGQITATVEESQGSVQNVKEAPRRQGNFVFTSPPSLIESAQKGAAPFTGETGYETVRTLFVMPPITMHFVVRGDAGINSLADLAGKNFVAGGRGTFTERQTTQLFKLLGLEGKVKVSDVELAGAVNAMRNRQIDGFATGSSHPTSHVQELSAVMPIKLLPVSDDELAKVKSADASIEPVTLAANTYQGQAAPVRTFGLPVGAYGTTQMDDATAYELTRIFWQRRDEMAKQNPWWNAVSPEDVGKLGIKLHPGALRYYTEAGIRVPETVR